jgi:hypothetical protein
MPGIRANTKSCLTKGCHATVHDVQHIDALALWPKEEVK